MHEATSAKGRGYLVFERGRHSRGDGLSVTNYCKIGDLHVAVLNRRVSLELDRPSHLQQRSSLFCSAFCKAAARGFPLSFYFRFPRSGRFKRTTERPTHHSQHKFESEKYHATPPAVTCGGAEKKTDARAGRRTCECRVRRVWFCDYNK